MTATPRRATAQDVPQVTRILVDAFADDPMWGAWAFPDPVTRRRSREQVFRLLVEGATRYPHVWISPDGAATAVWIPPGGTELSAEQGHAIDAVLQQSLGTRATAVLQAFELFERARPSEPHFYLTLLGTAPEHRGNGAGRRLLRANLHEVDRAGGASYLEAGDELVAFYEREGFAVTERFALDGGPTVNGMWREAQPLPSPLTEA
jgi:GNAT superfamily N-acetyltransferase